MTAREVLADLEANGATVTIDGENIRVKAAKGVLTPERREQIKIRKREIMQILLTHACDRCGFPARRYPEGVICFWCRNVSPAASKRTA